MTFFLSSISCSNVDSALYLAGTDSTTSSVMMLGGWGDPMGLCLPVLRVELVSSDVPPVELVVYGRR